jgi:hypothetical protein
VRGNSGRGWRGGVESRVGVEDPDVQLLQRRARLDPELVGEQAARLPEDGERLGAASAAVQRQHLRVA